MRGENRRLLKLVFITILAQCQFKHLTNITNRRISALRVLYFVQNFYKNFRKRKQKQLVRRAK